MVIREILPPTESNNVQTQESNQVVSSSVQALTLLAGIVLSIIFLLFGFYASIMFQPGTLGNSTTNSTLIAPSSLVSQVNTPGFAEAVILLFLGLSSGYNLAMSLKRGSQSYLFFVGILIPIAFTSFIVVLMNSNFVITNMIPAFFLVLGLLFSILYIHVDLVTTDEKYVKFINDFIRYVPNFFLFSTAIGSFALPLIEINFNVNWGLWNWIPAIIISLFIIISFE